VRKVLGLGSGGGRNLIFLAKKGFEVYGIDFSKMGLKLTEEKLKKKNLKAKLKLGDIFKKLPYKKNFFNALISIRVIHHQKFEKIKKLIREIERILKPGAYVFGTILEKEKGLFHFHFERKTLKKLLKNFKILKIWKDSENYLVFLAKLKP